MKDENNPSAGKETLNGDGEPTQEAVKTKFRASMMLTPEGAPILVFESQNADGSGMVFVIQGDDLLSFYQMLKAGIEGKGKRASYLG
jgi:hypothetical protein